MKKDIIAFSIIAAVIVLIASMLSFTLSGDYYQSDLEPVTSESSTILLSIECSTIFDNLDKLEEGLKQEKYLPSSGFILPLTEFVMHSNDTVLDILTRVTRAYSIHLDVSNFSELGGAYIKGINHIYEYSCGALSGWMYSVNGQLSALSVSAYKVQNGDIIRIMYTCALGNDLTLREGI